MPTPEHTPEHRRSASHSKTIAPTPAAHDVNGESPPSLRSAAGIIAGYFALQFLVGAVAALGVIITALLDHHGMTEGAISSTLAQPHMQAWLAVASLGFAAPVTLWLAHRQWRSHWAQGQPPGLGFVAPTTAWFFLPAIAIGLALPWLGSVLTEWLARGQTVSQDIQQIGSQTPLAPRVLLALVVVCVGPVVEELLFRGVLLSALLRRWRAGWAVALTSLVFALIHLPGLDYQWYALPALLLLAVLLAILRLRSGSIWPAVLAHATNNLVAVASWFVAIKALG
ncbi:type II CAAX endopeptidase family protein [Rhodanobacter sp. AS-Z3]|uniref:CPBP family intramembrane glutamic endopeptidase n=1 Tax=Rhodanobacter sp. AS-Z3 TaxID=3031330 RepID=UPI00247B246D|nr:type II CAAX endopeptidase family protein [Rhodanobacter sp. AS-Z3]WEN16601.1 type II CAAX endopeptidase family protein [Rhodanobacter sp. AS-Z3]